MNSKNARASDRLEKVRTRGRFAALMLGNIAVYRRLRRMPQSAMSQSEVLMPRDRELLVYRLPRSALWSA